MDIEKYLNNEYVIGTLAVFAIIYASQSRMSLPSWLVTLFRNDIFRVAYLSLLLMIPFDKAPHVSIIIAIVFVVTMKYIGQQDAEEHFGMLSQYRENFDQ
jgi:hypothetical protein